MARQPRQPQQPPAVDPNNVPETLCNGMFNLTWQRDLGILTFTHPRPQVGPLFANGTLTDEYIVRARIVMNSANITALRDFLSKKVKSSADGPSSGSGGETQH